MARILIIDDQPEVRAMLSLMLKRAGHETLEAKDGRRGLSVVASYKLDLVVTDILMPEKEGIETIIELRKTFPTLKIIAISGGGDGRNFDYLPMAERLGAHATLKKPFSNQDLLSAIDKLLGGNESE
ncbi:MAG: response regulator [Puniceicoccales bacterium]